MPGSVRLNLVSALLVLGHNLPYKHTIRQRLNVFNKEPCSIRTELGGSACWCRRAPPRGVAFRPSLAAPATASSEEGVHDEERVVTKREASQREREIPLSSEHGSSLRRERDLCRRHHKGRDHVFTKRERQTAVERIWHI